jgi:hypothetical protein
VAGLSKLTWFGQGMSDLPTSYHAAGDTGDPPDPPEHHVGDVKELAGIIPLGRQPKADVQRGAGSFLSDRRLLVGQPYQMESLPK